MATFAKEKHDLGFLRQDGTTTVGLRLARKNGVPLYSQYDEDFLANQLMTGNPDYSGLPPEKELSLRQEDWRSGFGQEFFDLSDPKRYHAAYGCDLRFKGMAIAGPLPTTITKPSALTLTVTDPEMDTWTDVNTLTNWPKTVSRAQLTQITGAGAYGGSGTSGRLANTESAGNAASAEVRGTMSFSTTWRGRLLTISAQAWSTLVGTGAASFRISWDNAATWVTIANITTGGSWASRSAAVLCPATATTLIISFIATVADDSAGSFQLDFDHVTVTNPTPGAIKWHVKFNSNEYIACGNVLAKLNTGGTAFEAINEFTAVITDLAVFGANLYIALGYSTAYVYMNTSEAFTTSTAVVNTFKYFTTVKGTADTFWGSDTASTIRSTTNPVNGGTAWSAATTVDSSTYSITNLFTRGNVLYIKKQDRCFYLDSSGNVQVLIEETAFLSSAADGKKDTIFLDDLYMPWGDQSLVHWDSSATTADYKSPSKYCTGVGDFVGAVQAVAADEEYLFAIVDNSTKVEVLAGRDETIDGVTSWVYHPIAEITLTGCETAFVSNVVKKRLYIASTDGTEALYYIPLTTMYGSIASDTNYTYKSGGTWETSWMHGNFRDDMKAFITITGTLGHTYDAGIYFTAKYKKLGDTSWTTIGNIDGTSANRTETLYIPVDGSSNKPKSVAMKFQFTAVTNDSTKTPILLNYKIKAIAYFSVRTIIQAEVLCDNNIVTKDGQTEEGQAATIKAALEEARAATWPVTFKDLGWSASADDIYVKFLPLQSSLVTLEKEQKAERHYMLKLLKVPLS
jgi:hypothetical protein